MKKIFLLFTFLIFIFRASSQHNVILLIADDVGTDYFGFYEDHLDTVDVPNIRALLAKGVRFKNAMSNPVCSSTRAGILTGRYSFRTGVGNIVGSTAGSGALDTAEITIPRLLKIYDPTIAKANIGKWHLHNPTPTGNLLFPNVLGYDHFEGPFIGALTSYTNWTKYTNGVASTITTYATTENVNNATTWLRSLNSADPFFLWMAFNAPHSPYHLPPLSLHTYTSLSGTTQDIQQHPKLYFKAALQALDTEIGRLLDSLQVMNKLDSTDFIFIGDNGNTMQTAQIANINRSKGTVYQYGVHVPFIVSGPSVVNPGRVSDALINTTDIFATVLELMGDTNWTSHISSLKPVDSKSILPIVKDQTTQIRPWSFCEMFKPIPDADDAKAIRNVDYKLIHFDAGQEEFYNLTNDPNELVNLLSGTLDANGISNYNYLCTEMTNLVGNGNFCNSGVGIKTNEVSYQTNLIYPNPFAAKLHFSANEKFNFCILANSFGEIIYSGNKIEEQDFSALAKGIYFLKEQSEHTTRNLKLIHN